jgi:hypothetical protein
MFTFTSLGGRFEHGMNDGRGPPQFVISGQNYHRIGSLIPTDDGRPKFAQLYIYDTENDISNRLSHFRWGYDCVFTYCLLTSFIWIFFWKFYKINRYLLFMCFSSLPNDQRLDESLITDLLGVMDQSNVLVKSFKMVHDFREVYANVLVRLCLFHNRNYDPRTYNVQEVGEVAALIVGDFDSAKDGSDIIVRENDGNLQRIHETHAKYLPLQYPLLFPFGEDQYQ